MGILDKLFGTYSDREVKRIDPIADKIEALAPEYAKLTNEELKHKTIEFKERLAAGETLDDLLVEAFATVREASTRSLGMTHFRVQLIGGIVLHQGRIAEMKPVKARHWRPPAGLPQCPAGNGVHVVTVNDYLAKLQGEWMGSLQLF